MHYLLQAQDETRHGCPTPAPNPQWGLGGSPSCWAVFLLGFLTVHVCGCVCDLQADFSFVLQVWLFQKYGFQKAMASIYVAGVRCRGTPPRYVGWGIQVQG